MIARGSAASYTIRDYRYHLTGLLRWHANKLAFKKMKELTAGPKIRREELIEQIMPMVSLCDITKDTLNEYLVANTKREKARSTISTWLYTFKSFYKSLNKASEGRIPDIAADIKRQAAKYEKAPHLTLKHTKKFLDYLASIPHDDPLAFRDKVFFLVMIKLGLRMEETLTIRKSDISFQEAHVSFAIEGKGSRKRFLPLPIYEEGKDKKGKAILVPIDGNIRFADMLKEYLESDTGLPWFKSLKPFKYKPSSRSASKKKEDFIFMSSRGQHLSHDMGRRAFLGYMAHLRLDNFGYTPHSLRHTAVTNWLYSGVDIETASKLAGHANISTTERIYAHTEVKKLSEGLAKSL
jgi:site-specific recombinase XerD